MLRKEWSLIVNSLMIQLAAGLFTFLALYRMILTGDAGGEMAARITAPGMAIAGPVILLGMSASLFHLGNPFRAYRAVVNVGSSWLSRESLFTGLFFVLWLADCLIGRNGMPCHVLTWLTVAAGFICVISMAGIYSSTGRPGWSGINTYTGFMGSIIIFGGIGSGAVLIISSDMVRAKDFISASACLVIAILAVRTVYQMILLSRLKPGEARRTLDSLVSGSSPDHKAFSVYRALTFTGLLLTAAGAGILLSVVIAGYFKLTAVVLMCVFVLAGEFAGRTGFYSIGLME